MIYLTIRLRARDLQKMVDVTMQQEIEEIDPNRLIARNGVLGYERGSGFEQITNFDLTVDGYVGDGQGHVIGYIIRVVFAVLDPLTTNGVSSRYFSIFLQ